VIRGIRADLGISRQENENFSNRMKPSITKRNRVTPYKVFTFLPGFWLGSGGILRDKIKQDCGAGMCEECEGDHMEEKCRAGLHGCAQNPDKNTNGNITAIATIRSIPSYHHQNTS